MWELCLDTQDYRCHNFFLCLIFILKENGQSYRKLMRSIITVHVVLG